MDSNNAVCAHFAWSIQTGYTPLPRETPTRKPVTDFESASEVLKIIEIVNNNTYNRYGNLEMIWWCSKYKTQMTQFMRYTWSVQNWVYTGQSKTGYTPPPPHQNHPQGERQPTGRSLILSNGSHVVTDLRFLPEASFGLRVLSLPPSVCLCVCVCGNHLLVRAITCRPFKLESPNLDQKSKTPWLRSLLFWGLIDLELQGQI